MTYNEHGKRIRSENLAGRIATKVAQGEGGLGLKTDMAYTVKHIQKGQALLCKVTAEGLLDSLILKLRGGWQNSSFGDKHPDWKPVMRKAVAPKKKE